MARNATESLCRRNPKLDTFLKRKLSANVYDRIRAYEECIISSEKEKRAFKHVVLSDERIYLTENPPKNITEDDSVPLEEITSVEMVHDYPDFLVGEERDNTQHISVVYTTAISSKLKKKEKNNKKKEPSELKNDNTSTMGTPRPTTPPSARSNDWRSTLTNSTPLSRKTGNKLRYSLNETELHKLASSSESTDEDRLSLSLPTSDFKKLSQNGDYYSDDDYDDDDIREQIEEYQRFSEDLTTQMLPCRPLPVRPEDNPDEYPSIDTARSYSSSLATTLRNPQESSEALEAKPLYRNLPHPGGNEYNPLDRRKAEPFKLSLTETGELTTPRSLRQEVILDKGKQGKKKKKKTEKKNQKAKQTTTMQLTLTNGDDSTSGEDRVTSEQVIYGSNHTKTAEIHIYILSLSSPFMMQLQCAWNNYIIRATLSLKKNSNDNFGAKNNKKLSSKNREQLELLFNQLKHEVMDSSITMEQVFNKMQELNAGARHHFVLKKLFWRSEDLFAFMISQLQRYLPKSPCNVNSERGRNHRADELDLTILLVDTIGLMFRETEICPARLSTLGANKGKAALDLLVVLTCFPEVPHRWCSPITKAATLMFESTADSWRTYEDAEEMREVSKLVQELTNVSTAVLYELTLIAHQANWGDKKGSFFNIVWLIKVLDTLQSTEKFIERVIAQAMRLLSPSKNETLSPDEALLLHQQFSVLQTFVEYSPTMALYMKNNYTEEFKYYVQSPYIIKKLPEHYPISKLILQQISEVLSYVLQKQTKLEFRN